jgi:hypothetical protein
MVGETMRVWRVAHETARDRNGFPSGPYTSGGLPEATSDAFSEMRFAHCDDRHPPPFYDGSLMTIEDTEHCAFTSLYALNGWFEHEWRILLFAYGFKVYVYEVPGARVGQYGQALFDRRTAQLISTTDLTD